MRRRGNTGKDVTIGIMLVAILTMAIGYAILQQRLNVEGTANVSSVWDIQVTGIREIGIEGLAETANLDYTPTTATFSTNLQAPGDYAYYEIEVQNKGTLTAYSSLDASTVNADWGGLIDIMILGGSKEPIPYENYSQFMGQMEKLIMTDATLSTTLVKDEKAYYYALVQFHESSDELPKQKEISHTINFIYEQAINFPMSKTIEVELSGEWPDGITVDPTATITNSSDYTSQQLTIKINRDTSVNTNVYSGCKAKISYILTNEKGYAGIMSMWWSQEEIEIFTNPSKTEQTYNFNLDISPNINNISKVELANNCL